MFPNTNGYKKLIWNSMITSWISIILPMTIVFCLIYTPGSASESKIKKPNLPNTIWPTYLHFIFNLVIFNANIFLSGGFGGCVWCRQEGLVSGVPVAEGARLRVVVVLHSNTVVNISRISLTFHKNYPCLSHTIVINKVVNIQGIFNIKIGDFLIKNFADFYTSTTNYLFHFILITIICLS